MTDPGQSILDAAVGHMRSRIEPWLATILIVMPGCRFSLPTLQPFDSEDDWAALFGLVLIVYAVWDAARNFREVRSSLQSSGTSTGDPASSIGRISRLRNEGDDEWL